MKILTLFASIYCLLITSALAGGVTIERIEGSSFKPVQNNTVRIVSVEVTIKDGSKVTEHIAYENISDKPSIVKIAYPLLKFEEGGFEGNDPQEFKAWINNKLVQVSPCVLDSSAINILFEDNKSTPSIEAYCWDIELKAKEGKNIKVEYSVAWDSDIRRLPEQSLFYIMRTVALWNGNISKADYSIQLPKDVVRTLKDTYLTYRLDIKPSGYKIKDSQIEWHFTNWKPTENINVTVVEEVPTPDKALEMTIEYYKAKQYEGNKRAYTDHDIRYKLLFGDDIPLKHQNMERLNAKALRNEIFARHGRIFTTPEMKRIFESAPWYKPRPDFKESELSDIEKKNIEFIFEFEKKKGWK